MGLIPSNFQSLLPSSNVKNLDTQRDKDYIIQSLIKNSTLEGWVWMLDSYSNEDISEIVKISKILTPRDVYFWSYFLKIPKKEILCLNKDLQTTQKTSWAY